MGKSLLSVELKYEVTVIEYMKKHVCICNECCYIDVSPNYTGSGLLGRGKCIVSALRGRKLASLPSLHKFTACKFTQIYMRYICVLI